MSKKYLIILFVFIISITTTSCQKYDVVNEESNNFPPINPLPEDKLEIVLYYPNESMDYLAPEFRVVPRKNAQIEEMVIDELLKGTSKKNLKSIVPASTKVLSIDINDGVAYVSFSSDLVGKDYTEKEEAFVIYSIVNSLTSISSINKVQILIDGKARDVLYKYYCIREPFEFSGMIVSKKYVSPVSIINNYYDSILNHKYDESISMLNLKDVDKFKYNTLKTYLIEEFKGIINYDIKDYTIYEYSDEPKMSVKYTISYEKGSVKNSQKNLKLIYNGEDFLIEGIIY
ncbi:GerMN domain-containing protein [Sporanaerobacter acetigenes]|uniref:GerMN domain-containing protein n=1 Tax=Sporanaerobacter acetigenes TaxID=165813 RepID=UPI00104F6A99|nr:GerMN domain-containing protein [Sporanaerobacter acetigenes]